MQHIGVHAVLHRKRSQRDVGLQTLRHHLGLELWCVNKLCFDLFNISTIWSFYIVKILGWSA
jgi:hypothetical protein